ncbi:hypothetical protein, partial [Clostridium beijerinckii]|uniref:hypothetical protein n=1 Tax=Clostridium beijerinckii TaxID=1520 RepID=UPI0022E254A0
MTIQSLCMLITSFLGIFFLKLIEVFKTRKENYVIVLLISLCFMVFLKFNYSQYILGEEVFLR